MEQRDETRAGEPLTLDQEEVCFHLRVASPSTLRDHIRQGTCPPPDFRAGRAPRWLRAKFFAWFEDRAAATAAAGEEALERDAS